jgi:hypothetical protein
VVGEEKQEAVVQDLLQDFGQTQFAGAELGDQRRTKRLVQVAERIARRPKGSLPDKMGSPKELRGLYRLMNNKHVTHDAVLSEPYRRTRAVIEASQEDVLLIHDTTEANLTSHRSLSKEVGQLGNGGGSRGFLCHNSIAITAKGRPLGLANQILHIRPKRNKEETRADRRKDVNRESRLWVRGRKAIGAFLAGRLVVDVCDRGGDTFEFLDYEHANKQHYLVRSHSNRVCQQGHDPDGANIKLHDHLRSLPSQGTQLLEVPPQPAQKGRPAKPGRHTTVAIAWAAVTLPAPEPGKARGEHRQEPLPVWALRVWEVSPPEGVEAVEWLLLTNVAVKKRLHAWERVDWYKKRWPTAEEFHKAQKTGCDMEGPQFTTAQAMKPMIGLLSVVAWLLMYLRWAGRDEEMALRPAVESLPEEWVARLSRWREGRERLDWSIRDFFLALARLGGHQNRKCDGPPGWQTLWKGWMKLHTSFELTPSQ